MIDERVEVTIKLPTEVAELLMTIAETAGVSVEDTFNVLLAFVLVKTKP